MLLVFEVNHLEIVIGRLRAASRRDRGGQELRKMCPYKEICFWAINIGNHKKEKTATLYITDY